MIMWDSCKEHENLVAKLIDKVQSDYNERLSFFKDAIGNTEVEDFRYDTDSMVYDIAVEASVLSWVKANLLETDGKALNQYIMKDSKGMAIYYVNCEDLEILMSINLIDRIISLVSYDTNDAPTLPLLFRITIENFSSILINDIYRTTHRQKQNRQDK